MHLQCTKKVLDFIKADIKDINTDDDIYAWHIAYKTILRKKFVVLMNDLTRYCVVLYGLKKSDFKEPVLLLQKAVFLTMEMDGFPRVLILNYVQGIKEVTYGKTKDRYLVAQLNRAMLDAGYYAYENLYDQVFQLEISRLLNRGVVGTNHWKDVHCPKDKMLEYLGLLV